MFPHLSFQISCYDCSRAPNEYQYIIDANHIPPEVENCSWKSNQTSCLIGLKWEFTFAKTELDLIPNPNNDSSSDNQHILRANALLTGSGVTQQWQHTLEYRCTTDRCNNLEQFKLLLNSLTFKSNFRDLADLIIPQNPFIGTWCLLAKNRTDTNCSDASTINPQNCQQCFSFVTTEARSDQICASCFTTDKIEQESLEREALFKLSSRSVVETWKIYCRAPQCNGLDTGMKIREKSTINLDFDQFLGAAGGAEQWIASALINGLVLLISSTLKMMY